MTESFPNRPLGSHLISEAGRLLEHERYEAYRFAIEEELHLGGAMRRAMREREMEERAMVAREMAARTRRLHYPIMIERDICQNPSPTITVKKGIFTRLLSFLKKETPVLIRPKKLNFTKSKTPLTIKI